MRYYRESATHTRHRAKMKKNDPCYYLIPWV
uniref:Uncharacterized protein n=1 Tax=Utricularia reniformis TaxID=192314 RepID=A0A1Y0AZW3_9LAMI|nr:hypothetical protein AEK19_MT0398 [Utricularia reniformis]ART30668.1 hypothetical protein AEK19_MT0398 [Utricularia reniformis]